MRSGAVLAAAFFLALTACSPVRPSRSTRPSSVEYGKPPAASGQFYLPLKKVQVLSRFGKRGRRFHTGIDIRGKRGGGDLIYASRAGKVEKVTVLGGYGRYVIIRHADGYTTRYAHLASYKVKQGQKVKALDPIGVVGRSGRATTAHLHFEITTPAGKFVNPENFLKFK